MVDLSARPGRYFCGIIAVCLLLNVSSLPAQSPQLAVSSFALDTQTLTPPTTKELAAYLAKETWCSAVPAETKGAWYEIPKGVSSKQWVSIVTVGFNGQADTYALMFDGRSGSLSMATHVPFREVWLPAGVAAWIWPTDSILGALRVDYLKQGGKPAPRSQLKLQVVPWEAIGSDAPATAKPSNLDDARTLAPELVLPAVEVMTYAAAFEAGWKPRRPAAAPESGEWGDQADAICEVRVEDQACSFRLKLRMGQHETIHTKLHVPWETYHEHLVRLFRYAGNNPGVSDFVHLGRQPVELLALNEGRLACLLNHELTIFDLATGKKSWTTEPAVKPATYLPVPQYTLLPRDKGAARLVRYRAALAEFNWESGKTTPLAPVGAGFRHQFSVSPTGDLTTTQAGTVALYHQGKAVWEHKESDAVSAGPLLNSGDVVYGEATGRLIARSAKEGKVRWESRLPGSLYGKIVPAGNSVLVFSNTAEALLAIDAATGTELWQCPVGDVLLETPAVVGNQIVVVSKGKRSLLLDLKTGTIQHDLEWPTWLVSATVVNSQPESMLACSSLSGKVDLLSLTDLKPMRTFLVGAQLSGPVLFAEKISYSWPVPRAAEPEENLLAEIKDGPVKSGPALLAADVQGILYILPLSSPE